MDGYICIGIAKQNGLNRQTVEERKVFAFPNKMKMMWYHLRKNKKILPIWNLLRKKGAQSLFYSIPVGAIQKLSIFAICGNNQNNLAKRVVG
jgi:hypothetical protein